VFECPNYVPVLRWKAAERRALQLLGSDVKPTITPLIEVPSHLFLTRPPKPGSSRMRRPPSPEARMKEIADGLEQAWGKGRALVDLSLLSRSRQITGWSPFETFCNAIEGRQIHAVPVISMLYSHPQHWYPAPENLAAVTGCLKHGACIRLKSVALHAGRLVERLNQLLAGLGLSPSEIDLLLDFECTVDGGMTYLDACSRLPYLEQWRTFTVVSGSFPKDLSQSQGFTPGDVCYRKRVDWSQWLGQVSGGAALPRIPAFGDYTIQFAQYSPPPRVCFPSASVRYTLEDKWLILRGEKIQGHPIGKGQWSGWAVLLCAMDEYAGESFSAGDQFIRERADRQDEPGESTDWLFAGINHHLTLTARQVASLFAS
jgi:hypothetical protein